MGTNLTVLHHLLKNTQNNNNNNTGTGMGTQEHGDHYDRMKELKEFDESKTGVKGLSDSGITSIPRIFVHPPESLSDLVNKPDDSRPSISIPVIDLSGINSPSDRPKLVDQVKQAAKEWGFFQVINHGIPLSVQNDTVSAVKAFHDLPNDVKSTYYKRHETSGVMYASNNDLYRTGVASWHDSLQVWLGPEAAEPGEIPEVCREEVGAWGSRAGEVAEGVMELLSEALGLPSGRLKELSFSETKVLVGHCYPYCPEPDRTMGIKPHTDPGALTVLMQNDVAGLQVRHEGVWVDVKPEPGGLVINVGDFLQIISNGEYTSVEHRVLANSNKEARISVVIFFNLGKWKGRDGYYGPLPELLSPEKPRVYRDFTLKEFNENFYSKGIDSKSMVHKVKL